MKLTDLLTSVGTGSQQNRRLTSFQGLGNPFAPQGGPPGPAGGGAGGGDSGDWWQDESGKWHFGGEAEHWWRDEHHQWHKGWESQTWRQDEAGNWHEVDEDHPRESEDELLMGGNPDMGEPQQDIKDLDALNDALKEDMPPMDPSFTPSIENIITKSGPSELGRNVAELSRALGQLKDDVNSNLSQDRIAAMTSEDVPNMVTPVAESLKEAKSMQDRLTAISDAAYSIVGTAAEDAERRLNGESPDEAAEGEADEAGDWYGGDHGYHDDYYGQQGGYGGYGQGGYDQGHGAYGAGQWDQGGQGQGQGQGQGMHLASIPALAALALPALAVQVDLGKRSRHLRHKHPQLKSFF